MAGIDQWIFNNAMDCIAWIADEINTHRSLIPPEERWYEHEETLNSLVPSADIVVQWERSNIVGISEADLDPQHKPYDHTPLTDDIIHSGFIAEARARRLARKRRRRRQVGSSGSSSEDDDHRENDMCSETLETQAIPTASEECPTPELLQMCHEINASPQRCEERAVAALNEEAEGTAIPSPIPQTISSQSCRADIPPPGIPECQNVCSEVELPSRSYATKTQAACGEPTSATVAQANDQPSTSSGITHDAVSQTIDNTPDTWTLNDKSYMRKVANLIKYNLNKVLERGYVHAFTERVRQAEMMKDAKERQFWVRADPDIDAWMLATGRKRDVFDIDAFINHEPNILEHLQRLRKTLNVRVMADRCPVMKAIEKKNNPDGRNNDGPQLSSQSYWSTFKSWFR